jgi:hypothetical protein
VGSECYCDYERPDLYAVEVRTRSTRARTLLKCYECHKPINQGDRYERVWARWAGDDVCGAIATCPRCLALREYVTTHVPCFCWFHGGMLDDARDTVDTYAHEAPGLWFGYLRRLVAVEGRKHPGRR